MAIGGRWTGVEKAELRQQAAGKTRLAVDPQNGNSWQADRSRTGRQIYRRRQAVKQVAISTITQTRNLKR
jgi:hypothetical protein